MAPNDLFKRGITTLGLGLDQQIIAQLCRYLAELQKWNRSINLVANAPEEILIETHFLDSLTLVPLVKDCQPPGLMDIGSGAGFPGLVLKIACPELLVTLVEPRQKRTSFLRQIIRSLGLQGVTVMETRLEESNRELATWQNSAPMLTSRAFASINKFLAASTPFCRPGGKIICMKGRKAEEELAEWQKESPDSPFQLSETINTNLPFSETPRKLLVFTKEPS